MATLSGLLLAVVTVLKALDIGMLVGFYRTFDPLSDPSYVASGYGVLRDSVGSVRAVLVTVALAVAVVAVLVLLPWAAVRTTRVAAGHRRSAAVGVVVAGLVWGLLGGARDDGRAGAAGGLRPDRHGRRGPRPGPAAGGRGPGGVRTARRRRPLRGGPAGRCSPDSRARTSSSSSSRATAASP